MINAITLKRKRESVITNFPTCKQEERKQEAKDFVEKINKERSIRFEFVRIQLENLRKEFKKEFNGENPDYYIFNY